MGGQGFRMPMPHRGQDRPYSTGRTCSWGHHDNRATFIFLKTHYRIPATREMLPQDRGAQSGKAGPSPRSPPAPARAEGGRLPAKLRRPGCAGLLMALVSRCVHRFPRASACLNVSWVLCLSNSHTLTHSLPAPSRQVEISTELSVARGGRGRGGGGERFAAKASWSLSETEHRLSGCQSWTVWARPAEASSPGQ